MLLSEKELPVEVANINCVQINLFFPQLLFLKQKLFVCLETNYLNVNKSHHHQILE